MLSTLALYRAGYDFKRLFTLSEFYDSDRTACYQAIQGVRGRELDMTGWLEFFVNGLATPLAEVNARGEMVIRMDLLAREHRLNLRQALALKRLLEKGELRIEDLGELCPGLDFNTG